MSERLPSDISLKSDPKVESLPDTFRGGEIFGGDAAEDFGGGFRCVGFSSMLPALLAVAEAVAAVASVALGSSI